MKRFRRTTVALLTTAPLWLTACGTTSGAGTPDEPAPEPSTEAAPAVVEVAVVDGGDPETPQRPGGSAGTNCPPVIRPDQGHVEGTTSMSGTEWTLELEYTKPIVSPAATIEIELLPSQDDTSEPTSRRVQLEDAHEVRFATSGWNDNSNSYVEIEVEIEDGTGTVTPVGTFTTPVYGDYSASAEPSTPEFSVTKVRDGHKLIHVEWRARSTVLVFHGRT